MAQSITATDNSRLFLRINFRKKTDFMFVSSNLFIWGRLHSLPWAKTEIEFGMMFKLEIHNHIIANTCVVTRHLFLLASTGFALCLVFQVKVALPARKSPWWPRDPVCAGFEESAPLGKLADENNAHQRYKLLLRWPTKNILISATSCCCQAPRAALCLRPSRGGCCC